MSSRSQQIDNQQEQPLSQQTQQQSVVETHRKDSNAESGIMDTSVSQQSQQSQDSQPQPPQPQTQPTESQVQQSQLHQEEPHDSQPDEEPRSPVSRAALKQISIVKSKVSEDVEQQIPQLNDRFITHIQLLTFLKWRQYAKHVIDAQSFNCHSMGMKHNRLAYDAGLLDESLMRQLFSLDSVMGDDTVRTSRKQLVLRIKELIREMETLRKRIHIWDRWLNCLPKHLTEEEKQKHASDSSSKMEDIEAEDKVRPINEDSNDTEIDEMNNTSSIRSTSSEDESSSDELSQPQRISPVHSNPVSVRINQPQAISIPEIPRTQPQVQSPKQSKFPSQQIPVSNCRNKHNQTPRQASMPLSKIFNRYRHLRLSRIDPTFKQIAMNDAVKLVGDLSGVSDDDLQVIVNDQQHLLVRGVKLPLHPSDRSFGWFEKGFEFDVSMFNLSKIQMSFNSQSGILQIVVPHINRYQHAQYHPFLRYNAYTDSTNNESDSMARHSLFAAPHSHRHLNQQTYATPFPYDFAHYNHPSAILTSHPFALW